MVARVTDILLLDVSLPYYFVIIPKMSHFSGTVFMPSRVSQTRLMLNFLETIRETEAPP